MFFVSSVISASLFHAAKPFRTSKLYADSLLNLRVTSVKQLRLRSASAQSVVSRRTDFLQQSVNVLHILTIGPVAEGLRATLLQTSHSPIVALFSIDCAHNAPLEMM